MSALAPRLAALGVRAQPQAPLSRLGYWRVGGPAEQLVDVDTLPQLQEVMALGVPVTPLGKGSNALIHDAGVPGVVLRLSGALAELTVSGTDAEAGAGLALTVLLARLDRLGLAGAEPFAGVPGTVGGAVVMNAGTTLGEASDVVYEVDVVLPGGELRTLAADALQFRYRHSTLPVGAVVARARLRLCDTDVAERLVRRRALMERRKATQPLDLPSCGSTFTNPPGDHAGRLIEAAGLKGRRVGGAAISERHANFFVNEGGATAEDLRQLIVLARREVLDRFGVLLTPEVRLLGGWEDGALEP